MSETSEKPKLDSTGTYVLEDDVLDEMENHDSTAVLGEGVWQADDAPTITRALDNDFLEDIDDLDEDTG